MITVEMLTLIALWCGNPINSTKGAMGFKTGEDISITQVNSCRNKLATCVDNSSLTGWTKCFQQTKMGD